MRLDKTPLIDRIFASSKANGHSLKMKFLFLFFFCFLSVQALTDEQKQLLRDHYKVCIEQTGVDRELVGRTRRGDFDFQDDKVEAFFFCMYKRAGLMNDAGEFLRDVAVSKAAEENRDAVGKAIDECLAEDRASTNEKTAFNYAKCYTSKRPDDFKFD